MPEAGSTWRWAFVGQPIEARHLRSWVHARITHPDAPAVASELFAAVLPAATVVEVTISTAGPRVQITATANAAQAPTLDSLGYTLVAGLAAETGRTPDGRGLWALLADPDA